MKEDEKALDADSPEAIEISNFNDALGAELASDFESTDSVETEDGDDKDLPSDDSELEDAPSEVKGEEEEEPPEEKGKEDDEEALGKATDLKPEKAPDKVVKLPAAPQAFPDLKDGDFVKNNDGTYVVHNDLLAQDISAIMSEDAGVYLRVYKAKPDKAEAMAQIMGFQGDDTRSPGRQMADVVRSLKKASKEQASRLLTQHFPHLMDPNTPAPFTYAEGVKSSREVIADVKVEDVPTDPTAYTETDLKNAIYKVVAESDGKLKIGDIEMDKLVDEMGQFRFDPATGEPLLLEERLDLAVEAKLSNNDIESEKEEDVREVPVGGNRKKSSPKKDTVDPELKGFSDALASQMGSF